MILKILLMSKDDVTFKRVVFWFENHLNKSTQISLTFQLKTLNNSNGKCSQPNDYTNITTNGIQKRFITTMFWIWKLITKNYNEWKHYL
jgi:hypothetical protein